MPGGAGRRRRRAGPGAGGRDARGRDRRRVARASATAPSARQARADGSVARPGGPADRRGDPRLDRLGPHRLLRPVAGGHAGRGVPPHHLGLPARVGDGAAQGSAHRPHRRRGVVGAGLRAAGDLRALRGSAHLLPGRLRRGARAAREGGSRREAPGHAHAGRAGAERPVERRDRGGRRHPGRLRRARLRRRHRRCRAGRPVRGGLRRLRRAAHARRRRGRDRGTGAVQLADPQLPGLPARGERKPAGRAGIRAGLRLRGELRVHESGDGARAARASSSRSRSRTTAASAPQP